MGERGLECFGSMKCLLERCACVYWRECISENVRKLVKRYINYLKSKYDLNIIAPFIKNFLLRATAVLTEEDLKEIWGKYWGEE